MRLKKFTSCEFSLSPNIQAFKSFSCYKEKVKKSPSQYPYSKLKIVFYASKKRKPSTYKSKAFLLVPLKNWGTLYFIGD